MNILIHKLLINTILTIFVLDTSNYYSINFILFFPDLSVSYTLTKIFLKNGVFI